VVQEMLGHSHYSTTMDIYSHVDPVLSPDKSKIAFVDWEVGNGVNDYLMMMDLDGGNLTQVAKLKESSLLGYGAFTLFWLPEPRVK